MKDRTVRETSPSVQPDAKELGQLLDAFLRTLSQENQLVFLRRYWYVETVSEIASRYRVRQSSVRFRLYRIQAMLCGHLAGGRQGKDIFLGLAYIGVDLIEKGRTAYFPTKAEKNVKRERILRSIRETLMKPVHSLGMGLYTRQKI